MFALHFYRLMEVGILDRRERRVLIKQKWTIYVCKKVGS